MAQYDFSFFIGAPVQRVFDIFSDFRSAPSRVKGIKKLEVLDDGPIRAGVKFRETRIMFGKEATETMEISEFQPGKSYSVTCNSCGVRWVSTFQFAPQANGTKVDLTMQMLPLTLFAKLMSPLASLMSGSMKKCITQDMEDLKRAAEGGA